MTALGNKRWFAWVILALCILAIPVGLLSAQVAKHEREGEDGLWKRLSDHIQVIRLTGLISDKEEKSFIFEMDDSATTVLKQLRKATKNDHVKGILLRINSPGGTVSMSQEIWSALKAYKKSNRPVVVSMGDMAASGGYYIASASDKIVAEPGTLTGSIGVIMNLMNLKGLGDKLGLQPEVIKSGQFKDIASPYRPMTAEEKSILQALIMDSYDQFVSAVAEGRKMDIATVKKIADGRVYSGRQALKLHLVDELGGYDESLDSLQKICMDRFHLSDKLPVDEKTSEGFLGNLLESSGVRIAPLSKTGDLGALGQILPESMSPKYFHQPMWVVQ